jgi:general secretion pathway protein J
MTRRLADRREHAGFTLVELLVVLAVFGLLAVALAQGTRLGIRAWNAETKVVAERDQLDATDRALRLLVEHVASPGAGAGPQLQGTQDAIETRTTLPESVALASRLADIRIQLVQGHRLLVRWRPHLHEIPFAGPPPWQDAELLSGVERIRFSYRAVGADAWRDDWSDASLPAQIRIHLDFAPGDPRRWPDIVVAPVYLQVQE